MVIVQGKKVNLLSEAKLALMRTLVVGSISHNVQETLKKTGKRITYKGDLRAHSIFILTHAFISVSRILSRKSHVISKKKPYHRIVSNLKLW